MEARQISRKDLCEHLNMSDGTLRSSIKRGSIREHEKGYVDLDDEFNKEYILNYANKKKLNVDYLFNQDYKLESNKDERTKLDNISKKKKEFEANLKETEYQLKSIELEKKKAKVIPTEFAIEMIQRYFNGTFGDLVNSGNKLIDQICNELDADIETKLKYKKMFKAIITETIQSKHKPVSKEIIDFAKQYSLQKGW